MAADAEPGALQAFNEAAAAIHDAVALQAEAVISDSGGAIRCLARIAVWMLLSVLIIVLGIGMASAALVLVIAPALGMAKAFLAVALGELAAGCAGIWLASRQTAPFTHKFELSRHVFSVLRHSVVLGATGDVRDQQ
jgi:hypothetical protein